MPLPSGKRQDQDGGDLPENGLRQRLRDANDLFEGHLAGLVKAFELSQQHSYELLDIQEPFCCGVRPTERPLTFKVEHAFLPAIPDAAPTKSGGEVVKQVSQWEEKEKEEVVKAAYEQFQRLMDQDENLSVETLVNLLLTYHPDQEFEDLQAMVVWVMASASPKEEEQHEDHQPRRWLNSNSSSSHTFAPELLSVKLDFAAFERLKLAPLDARGAKQRDVQKLRKVLRSEELQALFKDEPLDDEKTKSYYVLTLAQARVLEFVPAMIIVLNSICFAFQDLEGKDPTWEVIENLFICFYILEALIKLRLMGCRGYFRGPEWAWNCFDFFCIIMSLVDFGTTQAVRLLGNGQTVDLSILMMLKMLRLARLARLIRALRYPIFRELNMMVMGVISGIRVLIWAIVLLMSFIYAFGVGLYQLIGEDNEEFETVMDSMLTLFRCFTDGCVAFDGTPLQERLRRKYGWGFFISYTLLFMLVTVGIFNLIMAIFIDNVMTSQLERKQRDLSETADETEVNLKENLCRLLTGSKTQLIPTPVGEEMKSIGIANLSRKARVRAQFDCLSGESVVISRDAFRVWLQDTEFLQVLETADIDIHNKSTLFDIMDADMGGSLSTDEVFQGLMQMRGPPTKGDIIGISLRVTHIAQLLQDLSEKVR